VGGTAYTYDAATDTPTLTGGPTFFSGGSHGGVGMSLGGIVGPTFGSPFDPNTPDAPLTGPAIRVSKDGAIGMIAWRQDGKELYYMTRNWEVMADDIETTPTFKAGTPRMPFSLPGPLPGNPLQCKNVSPDGQRFLFAMPTNASTQR
jgi:hypothetical protein